MPITTVGFTVGGSNFNDGENFILSPEGMDLATVTWRRTQVQSPFVEGRFTTNRQLDQVESTVTVDVLGASAGALQSNMSSIVTAFSADEYVVALTIDGATWSWNCEAADYAVLWQHERWHALRVPMRFTFLRQPTPASGPV